MDKKYKILILAEALLMSVQYAAYAQSDVNRIVASKLNGYISLSPSESGVLYDTIATELVRTGTDGFNVLLDVVKANESKRVAAEYAITAIVAKISGREYDEVTRDEYVAVLEKEAQSAPEGQYKEFMIRELMVLGVNFDGKNETVPSASDFDIPTVPPTPDDIKAVLRDKTSTRQGRFFMLDNAEKNAANFRVVASCLKSSRNEDAIVDMLYWFGTTGDKRNASIVKPYVSSRKSVPVCREAVMALLKLGDSSDVQTIANLYSSKKKEFSDIATVALKSYQGNVTDAAVSMFEKADNDGKADILSIICQRRDEKYQGLVKDCLDSQDQKVSMAAYEALSGVVRKSDTQFLYNLLENCAEDKVSMVQKAVVSSFDQYTAEETNVALIDRKNYVGKDKENLYWPMIISTSTIDEVFNICVEAKDEELFRQAFSSYMNAIRAAKEPGAKQLLRYRDLMPYARTAEQKNMILDRMATTDCFLAIIYAGGFLNEASIQQKAAQVIRRIGTAHIEYNSPDVIELLKRAAVVITGTDPGYEVTSINKHLEDLPKNHLGYLKIDDFLKEHTLDKESDFYDVYVDCKYPTVGSKWNSFHIVRGNGHTEITLNGVRVTEQDRVSGYIDEIFSTLLGNGELLVRDAYALDAPLPLPEQE